MTDPLAQSDAPVFGDYAAEYEEWGRPQRAAAARLAEQALALNAPGAFLDAPGDRRIASAASEDAPGPAGETPGGSLDATGAGGAARGLQRWLDVGAGTGFIQDALARAGVLNRLRLINVDSSLVMLRFAAVRRGAAGVCADAAALPFAQGVFDHVLSSFCYHWLADPGAFLGEVHRCLRPGGWLSLAVPVTGSLKGFYEILAPLAHRVDYHLNFDLYPDVSSVRQALGRTPLAVEKQAIEEFAYRPRTVREMLLFMRFAAAGRIVRRRHEGDFWRFAARLVRLGRPVPIVFRTLFVHARRVEPQ
ncbi:MAG: hypothetical protein Kow0059_06440 [Candidatus Sumerlaeia bacterium]